MTRRQQLDSEDVQTALAMLWAVCTERIATCGAYQYKRVAAGVNLWHVEGAYYLEATP